MSIIKIEQIKGLIADGVDKAGADKMALFLAKLRPISMRAPSGRAL